MTSKEKNLIMDEKFKNLESNCDHLYNQITELRTTVQEIYGEIAESDRFVCKELFRLSERLETMAKEISKIPRNGEPAKTIVKFNPTTNISPTMTNEQNIEAEKQEEKKSLFSYLNSKTISISIAIFVGFLAIVGTVCIFVYKAMDFFNLLN
jgi:regulator of replication initiation timing